MYKMPDLVHSEMTTYVFISRPRLMLQKGRTGTMRQDSRISSYFRSSFVGGVFICLILLAIEIIWSKMFENYQKRRKKAWQHELAKGG